MSEVQEQTGNEIPNEIEQKAMAQGWVPKDQWDKDPEQWTDAKTFVEKGEKIQAIRKERNDHLTKEVRELRQLIVEQRDMAKKARLQGYQQALQEIEQRQLKAVEDVDTEAFKAAKADEKRVLKEYQDEVGKVDQKPTENTDPEFEEWRAENDWFTPDDPDLYHYAIAISDHVMATTGYKNRQLYDEVTKRVKKNFPHKFGNQRRNDPPAVSSGGDVKPAKKSGHTFDDLPQSAKDSYNKLAKQFKMQGIEFKKEEYLADYVWE